VPDLPATPTGVHQPSLRKLPPDLPPHRRASFVSPTTPSLLSHLDPEHGLDQNADQEREAGDAEADEGHFQEAALEGVSLATEI